MVAGDPPSSEGGIRVTQMKRTTAGWVLHKGAWESGPRGGQAK